MALWRYVDRTDRFGTEGSTDGRKWRTVDGTAGIADPGGLNVGARNQRLVFSGGGAAVWKWVIR